MSEDNALGVVFQTAQYAEAAAIAAMLNDARIPAELFNAQHNALLTFGGDAFAVRVVVPAERAEEAIALIEDYMKSIGAAESREPAKSDAEDALLPCPNCEKPGIALREKCSGCGYAILPAEAPPVSVKEHAPGARTFCPECRGPLTFPSGTCASCGEELEPLEKGDLLCPPLEHVLYRDTVGGWVCKACERVWVELG